jgi:hypothetical protein
MLTTGLNALALVHFEGLRFVHGGGRDGFGFLLIGLGALGVVIWAFSRSDQNGPAKN